MSNLTIKLKEFLDKKQDKQKLIVIYWPTASWKTSLSIDIAKSLDSEIISADSRQIFKFLNIWTAKITEEEKKWIKHHMIDIVNPNENYSVWEYKNTVLDILNDLFLRWKIPIICWWTWLYIDCIIYDFSIPKVLANEEYRRILEKEAIDFWKEYLYEKLKKIDPEYVKTLHYNNLRYVIRALEIYRETWKIKSDFIEKKVLKYDTLFLTPYDWNRILLYERIDKRVEKMIDLWLVDEVKWLLKMWYKEKDFWLKTIWYEEIVELLNWKITKEETIELIKKNSRNYAKRQLTWFRKYDK